MKPRHTTVIKIKASKRLLADKLGFSGDKDKSVIAFQRATAMLKETSDSAAKLPSAELDKVMASVLTLNALLRSILHRTE